MTLTLTDPSLDDDVQDLALEAGLGLIHKNRPANNRGQAHVGVVVLLFKQSECVFKEMKLLNLHGYKVLPVIGTMPRHKRRMVVVACYIPPG